MCKKYNFVYQTKNIINNKTYIGVHSTNNINDGYIGNGIKGMSSCKSQIKRGASNSFVRAVYKYGYENFNREILCFFDTKEEAYEEESFLVDSKWIVKKDNYNTSLGGLFSNKLSDLHEKRKEINEMFSDPNNSYSKISKTFGKTKGSWLSLIDEKSITKRKSLKKDSFYKGLQVINLKREIHTLENECEFFNKTGLNKKSIHKLKNNEYASGWFLKDSKKFNNKIKELEGKYITVNNIKYSLIEVYGEGVLNFSKMKNIKLPTLEKKIKTAKK